MKRIGIFLLDILFTSAVLGVLALFILLVISLLIIVTSRSIVPVDYRPSHGINPFWGFVALWIALTALMLVHCLRNTRANDFRANVWMKIILVEIFIVGPVSYYIAVFRPRVLGRVEGKIPLGLNRNRTFLDVLYFLTFWGSISCLSSFGGILFLSNSIECFEFLGAIGLVLMPISGIPHIIMALILLMDAAERPKEEWEKINFLILLNPWAWIFGVRRYYLSVLRPELD